MAGWSKWLWGGVGWAVGGPLGAILGFALGSMSAGGGPPPRQSEYTDTKAGDFGLSLLVLFASVMKADRQVLRSELDYVKKFFVNEFGIEYARHRMQLFNEILKQELPLREVCVQIRSNMDHASRLQLIHVLFGLSKADGMIHPVEVEIICQIANYLGISSKDYDSIEAMFIHKNKSAYKILEIESDVANNEVKKAFRRMATKYHPDKVTHLGTDFQKLAEDKFKTVNEAYQQIKSERGFA